MYVHLFVYVSYFPCLYYAFCIIVTCVQFVWLDNLMVMGYSWSLYIYTLENNFLSACLKHKLVNRHVTSCSVQVSAVSIVTVIIK